MGMRDEPTVAILGNGGAAAECVLALRQTGFGGRILMFADNALPPANPTLMTYFLAGKLVYGQLFPFGQDFFEANGVETVFRSPVVSLDTANRTVRNAAGFESSYDRCLIATGAVPLQPPVPGINSARVFVMRTLSDAIRLKASLKQRPRRALVIGASMVGIKLVELLVGLGVPVCLADMATQVFPQAAHPDCSRVIEKRIKAIGVSLRLGVAITGIESAASGVRAFFGDAGAPEDADLVLMCVGVKPSLDFLDQAVACERGVLVDEYMRTSVDGVYAAGDVAQAPGLPGQPKQIFGLWASARMQGRTAGAHMAGAGAAYPAEVVHNITHFLGMTFVGIGDVKGGDQDLKVEREGGYAQFFWKRDQLVGANLINSDLTSGAILNALLKNALVGGKTTPAEVCDLLEPSGRRFVQHWKTIRRR